MSAAFPLDAEVVRGFVEQFLLPRFHESAPIGMIHHRLWELATSAHPRVAIAAPRKHGKSTAVNHAYGLAAALSKQHPFQLKICATYPMAVEKIEHAKVELTDNAPLRRVFRLRRFLRERENDIVAEMEDGYQFRMMGYGMDQKKRGLSWGTMRPTLFILDDIEDEEEVLNAEVRAAQWRWLNRTLIPMGGDKSQVRVIGTILHQHAMLARLLRKKTWKSERFEACDEEVSEDSILWPAKFSRATLLDIKNQFIEGTAGADEDSGSEGSDLAGFNMEYRNIAVDESTSFFRSTDFRPMTEEDHRSKKTFYVGGDLAFSTKDKRDYAVLYIGGIDEEGILHIVDERRGRWDGKRVIDELYSIHEAWEPDEYYIEGGAILETLKTALEMRMAEEGYLNICPGLVPTKDKATRAMPAQARMRHRGVKWDTEAPWFPEAKNELLDFAQGGTRGAHDDRVDALAWLCQGLKRMALPQTDEEVDIEDLLRARREARRQEALGQNNVSSYSYYRSLLQ